MLETAPRPSPLDRLAASARPLPAAELTALGPAARLSLRLRDEGAIASLDAYFGVALPREACRFSEASGRSALWLGPDEWLLLAPGEDGAALRDSLEAALAGVPHSLVDVSERSVAIALSGPRAANVLNAGCPLDLSLGAFPVGMATRTVLAKSEIVLMRRGEELFEIDVWRSFAPYVWQLLDEARREFIA